MISERMKPLVMNNSAIRTMFEEGNRLAKIYGRDKVFDFRSESWYLPEPQHLPILQWCERSDQRSWHLMRH